MLDDPISEFLPAFAHTRVAAWDDSENPNYTKTVAAKTPITFRHLLTHTSGLTYA